MSIRNQLITALTVKGERRIDDHVSRKYVVFTRADGGFYFIGKSGALRFGMTVTSSIPVSSRVKLALLEGRWS